MGITWCYKTWVFIFISILTDFIVVCMYCFSGCWCGCWAGCDAMWWRETNRRENRVTVERGFCRWETSAAWQIRWDLTSSWLWDESGCNKACQQPCCVLHLYDVVSTHESAWSMAQSTTQTHCPVTLYFPLTCHSNSPYPQTHMAAVWLRTMLGVL